MPHQEILSNFLEKAGITLNGRREFDIQMHDERLLRRMVLNPSLGAGEGYVEGWWDCERLDELFSRICRYDYDNKLHQNWAMAMRLLLNNIFNMQTLSRSKRVAEVHYNLGNELYNYMLGPSMAYTCGYWKDTSQLDQAQFNKFDLVCRKIGLKRGDRVLELGCGWGSFAKFAAENYGCDVVGMNISSEQVRYAQESCRHLPVKIHLCDYRNAEIYNPQRIPFDKAVSIGLCEHVGYKNYRHFLTLVRENLKDDGLFLLHTIGKTYSSHTVDPWINKYIFPNGMLPSIKKLSGAMEGIFVLEDLHNFGADYDKTLMAWHQNFTENWHLLEKQYGKTFYRLWNYYLLSCAGAFRARSMQLWQMVLSPKGMVGGYHSVR